MVGNQTRVKVVKNKVAPPFKQVEFDIMYGEGISKTGELVDLGVKAGIVEKSGAWFSFDSERIGQGRENAKAYLKEHPEMAAKIERAIRQNAGLIAGRILEGAAEPRRRRRAARPDLPRARAASRRLPAERPGVAAAALDASAKIGRSGLLDRPRGPPYVWRETLALSLRSGRATALKPWPNRLGSISARPARLQGLR